MAGGAPLFQQVAGPHRIDDVVDGTSTMSPEERTIRPHETYSSPGQKSGRSNETSASSGNGSAGENRNGYGYAGNHNEHTNGGTPYMSDPLSDLRHAVDKLVIGSSSSHPGISAALLPSSSAAQAPVPVSAPTPALSDAPPTTSSTAAQPAPPKPKDFSDDILEEMARLGEGAGGAVHQVRDRRDGQIYARKTITTREVAMKQVVRELNIISTTQHVNIVQCFGAYMSPSSSEVKIMMEFCDGGSLEAVGKKIKEIGAVVGEKIAGRLAEGVLQGLAYLHSKKTIHRDIKPSNILLSRDGIVKLADFGVSGELVESIVGTFTGTLIYMAPERISGGKYTVRSDVWSTGISLLELVQNRFPFAFPTDVPTFDVILTISKGQPPGLEDDPDAGITWSVEMKDFIRQALKGDPNERPTPKEMLVHPWILNTMKQEVHMARWIRQVWGWPKRRKSRENSQSRPNTSNGEFAQDSPRSSSNEPTDSR